MKNSDRRKGGVLVLVAVSLIGLMLVVAYCIDYGYLLLVRTDLQRCADAAALAAAQELLPDEDGNQPDDAEDNARAVAQNYANLNARSGTITIATEDIEIGNYDAATVNSGSVTILSDALPNTVRVTLRLDGTVNSSVPLFFGRVIGANEASMVVTATAAIRRPRSLAVGNGILPMAMDESEWNSMSYGDEVVVYGDGRVEDQYGNQVAGNWGTVDIGNSNNSTNDLRNQIENGLRQSDLDFMAGDTDINGDPRIPDNTELPPNTWVNGDPGLSAGMQSALSNVIGQTRMIPIVDQISGGNGNNSEFHVVRWGVVNIVSAQLTGKKSNKHVRVRKTSIYNGSLRPHSDLSVTTEMIDGAFGPAGLIE